MIDEIDPADLLTTVRFLAGRGIAGCVWTDPELNVTHRFGDIVAFVPVGRLITETVLPLMGFDDQIFELQRRQRRSVGIPNVLLDPSDRNGLRINLAVYWLPEQHRFVLLVARAVSRTDLEVVLTAQVRARAIAEADVTAKSHIIARANDDLMRANQDLQEFASVISHDLRSPLRRLRYFASDAEAAIQAGNLEGAAADLAHVRDRKSVV